MTVAAATAIRAFVGMQWKVQVQREASTAMEAQTSIADGDHLRRRNDCCYDSCLQRAITVASSFTR